MVLRAIAWAGLAACVGCAAQPSNGLIVVVSGPHDTVAARAPAGFVAGPHAEVPERDPAARGRSALLSATADLPDDRDGDGVDQLELCPELPPERVDGCPRAR